MIAIHNRQEVEKMQKIVFWLSSLHCSELQYDSLSCLIGLIFNKIQS